MVCDKHLSGLQIGYRYWDIDKEGKLVAPIWSGLHWKIGHNRAHCDSCDIDSDRIDPSCSCGFYAWPEEQGEEYCNSMYFTPSTGRVDNSQRTVMGAVLMHNPYCNVSGMLRSRQAVIAAFALPIDAKKQEKRNLIALARRYQVALVRPDILPQAAQLAQQRVTSVEPLKLKPKEESFDLALSMSKRTLKEWLLRRPRHAVA